jgi:uncharacterized phage-associated protein
LADRATPVCGKLDSIAQGAAGQRWERGCAGDGCVLILGCVTTTALDVAAAVLERTGAVSAYKLQKLVYYAQAWSLVWDGVSLFDESIEAWGRGPVVRSLYRSHAGQWLVSSSGGTPTCLSPAALATIDEVVRFYGAWDGDFLSELSHRERPWLDARGDLSHNAASKAPIAREVMREFYASFDLPKGRKHLPDELARGLELLVSLSPADAALLSSDALASDDELRALE